MNNQIMKNKNDKNEWIFLSRHSFFSFIYSNVEQYCLTVWQKIYHEINNNRRERYNYKTIYSQTKEKPVEKIWNTNVYSNQKCLNEFFDWNRIFYLSSIDMNHQEHLHRSRNSICVSTISKLGLIIQYYPYEYTFHSSGSKYVELKKK